MQSNPKPGQLLARGVMRHFRGLDIQGLVEFPPKKGLRVDIMALTPTGEIWIVECKSSRVDFTSDHKWQNYREWCDQFYFAVPADFPMDLLPEDAGLIIADAYGAEMIKPAPTHKLAAARRHNLTLKIARAASLRLQHHHDPRPS